MLRVSLIACRLVIYSIVESTLFLFVATTALCFRQFTEVVDLEF